MKKPVALVILDGFGYRAEQRHNAVAQAHMHHFQQWLLEYPHALLQASGTAVGLPEGTVGNSMVGHTTLGAGRIVKQPLTLLDEAIANGSFFKNSLLIERFKQLRTSGGTLHLMGLLSDGSSHSNENHLYALLRMAHANGITHIVVHAFLDGRDVLPRSAAQYLSKLDDVLREVGCGVLGTIHGRAYAMDRNDRHEYLQKTYNVLTQPHKSQFSTWQDALEYYYEQGLTDEFIPPTTIQTNSYIKQNDGLIFFNIRADRARELTHLFVEEQFPQLLWMVTGVPYGNGFHLDVLCPMPVVEHTLLDVLDGEHKSFLVIAESEKYAHVSYFFNGGRDVVHAHESRIIIPSISFEKFTTHPEMAAIEITDTVLRSLAKNSRDFYLVNYANPDMVGHTGDFSATIKALQCIDQQLERLYMQLVEKMGGTLFIVADHGKAEDMFDVATGQPRTSHTLNPVYFLMLNKAVQHKPNALPLMGLADVTPFILTQMKLPVPMEMQAPVSDIA